jgi:uncharacterized membrane protein
MNATELPHLFFRWLHVLAGIMAVGQIWTLAAAQRLTAEHTHDPGLRTITMSAHTWLIRAAGLSWVTGFVLLGIVYYGGGALTSPGQSSGLAIGVGLAVLPLAYIAYDLIWTVLRRHDVAATFVSLAFVAASAAVLTRIMTGRAAFIHLGAMLGTIVVANVSARIWPVERRRLAPDARPFPSADQIAVAALRMRHNAALAVAIVLFMVSNHFPLIYGQQWSWLLAPGITAAGWLATWPALRETRIESAVRQLG